MSDLHPDADEISSWCVRYVADMLERAPAEIDPSKRFSRIGFDSAMSVQLVVAIEAWLGIQLDPDVMSNHPTIARLAAYVAGLCDDRAGEPRN